MSMLRFLLTSRIDLRICLLQCDRFDSTRHHMVRPTLPYGIVCGGIGNATNREASFVLPLTRPSPVLTSLNASVFSFVLPMLRCPIMCLRPLFPQTLLIEDTRYHDETHP